jgi:hypothetical protein
LIVEVAAVTGLFIGAAFASGRKVMKGGIDAPEAIELRAALQFLLNFIPTGALPPNRSEFLLRLNFGELLETVSANYDLVLLDPPPILAMADAPIIGTHVRAVCIMTRAGVTSEGEINESVKRLDHAGISPQAVLFNDMVLRLGSRRSAYSCDGGGHPGDTPGTGARWPQSGRSAGATAAWAGRCSSMRLSTRRIR